MGGAALTLKYALNPSTSFFTYIFFLPLEITLFSLRCGSQSHCQSQIRTRCREIQTSQYGASMPYRTLFYPSPGPKDPSRGALFDALPCTAPISDEVFCF